MPRVFIEVGTKRYTGPSLKSVLEENNGLQIFLTKTQMASVLRFAGTIGGELWKTVFLPKRFEMAYATLLGYHVSAGYNKWKVDNVGKTVSYGGAKGTLKSDKTFVMAGPQPTPFYASGSSMAMVLSSAYVTVAATSSRVVIRIRFRLGNIAYKKSAEFTTLPAWEYARVVQEVDRVLRLRFREELESKGKDHLDARIINFKDRQAIEPDLRKTYAPFMDERKAL